MEIESRVPLLLPQHIDRFIPGVMCELVCSQRNVFFDERNIEKLISEWDGCNSVVYPFKDSHSGSKYRLFFRPEMINWLKSLWEATK